MIDYQSIGFTKKTHGIKGELRLKIEDRYMEDIAQVEVVFLNIEGRKIPYFIEVINFENPFTIKFEEQNSKESAIRLTGKEIFLRTTDLIPDEDRTIETIGLFYEKLIGFQLRDKAAGLIGKIEEIVEYPQQEMAVVLYRKNEILIPLNEQLILEINEKSELVLMDLPEGLLDIGES